MDVESYRTWYLGLITAFDERTMKHTVNYEDNTQEHEQLWTNDVQLVSVEELIARTRVTAPAQRAALPLPAAIRPACPSSSGSSGSTSPSRAEHVELRDLQLHFASFVLRTEEASSAVERARVAAEAEIEAKDETIRTLKQELSALREAAAAARLRADRAT